MAVANIELTYFQPRVVLHELQNMSATACSPVSKNLSSARPQLMLTLKRRDVHVRHYTETEPGQKWLTLC